MKGLLLLFFISSSNTKKGRFLSWAFPHWILWRDDFFRSLPHLLIYERLVSLELPSCRKRKTNTWDPIFRAGASFNFNFQLADDSTFPPWIVTIFNIYLQYSISILTIFMTLASLENNIFAIAATWFSNVSKVPSYWRKNMYLSITNHNSRVFWCVWTLKRWWRAEGDGQHPFLL